VVEINVHRPGGKGRLVLFADLAEFNLQDYDGQVFGSYWFDHGARTGEERMAGGSRSRIDIVQGPDEKLYYRKWQMLTADERRTPSVVAGPLPTNGSQVAAFQMPFAKVSLAVNQFVSSRRPEIKILPEKFNSKLTPVDSFRAAKVRLTVDRESRECWVLGRPVQLAPQPVALESQVVRSGKRMVSLRMPLESVPLGFSIRLLDFERRLDPGTSQPSHYSSYVDLVDRDRPAKKYNREPVWITMNAPINFEDPSNGRGYRLYQEGFGPQGEQYRPGHPMYNRYVSDTEAKDNLYWSVLTVNYDPGRGVKYAGCLLVVAGIATMFYMRAYFFKPRAAPAAQPPLQRRPKAELAGKR
jgi:hypothetical protein